MGVGGSVMWRKGREGGSADKKGERSARPLSSIPAWVSKAKQVEQQTRQGSAWPLSHCLAAWPLSHCLAAWPLSHPPRSFF